MTPAERLAELSERLSPRLLAYFARRVAVREDAADLLVETLTIAWRRTRTLPDDSQEATGWMFGVASRVLANHRRGLGRRDRLTARLRDELRDSVDDFDSTDTRLDVQAAIDSLSVQDAELIRLVFWDGLSATEAGAALGMPGSTARLRVSSARQALAKALGADEPANLESEGR